MAFTLIGWYESQDTSGSLTAVAGISDPHVRVSGDDIIVPTIEGQAYSRLLGVYAAGTGITRAQLRSPSLRRLANLEVNPLNRGGLEPLSPVPIMWMGDRPVSLETEEALNAYVAEDTTGAEAEVVLAWLGTGPMEPVEGNIFSVRVTSSTTLSAGAWTNGSLTFDQTLPKGRYAIVGAIFRSTGLVAFRFVGVGISYRPGGLGGDAVTDLGAPGQRWGGWGVWLEFEHNTPPTVDFLSASADTSETGELDLIKIE